MLFNSSVHLLVYTSVLFVISHSTHSFSKRFQRDIISNYEPKCRNQNTAIDQVVDDNNNETVPTRRKRFVLFPEFILFLNDWRYIHRPKDISYWIANFYPNRINTDYIHHCIEHIIQQINTVTNKNIIVHRALDPGEANFHFHFFDYTKCPIDDVPEATIDNVQVLEELYIYSIELTRTSRYRAHGGIHIVENDRSISTIKLNMQQTFLDSNDFVYDPVIYTCNDTKNECEIDLYYVLLHETLHGFGIEHTTNAQQPIPPNSHMQSVMYFSPSRILCHDDIRAIRMVYELPVIRKYVDYDDTCRRDFPMNSIQKLMYQLGRLLTVLFIIYSSLSTITSFLTVIYILTRHFRTSKSVQVKKQTSTISTNSWLIKGQKPMIKTKRTEKHHGYLWHDEML